MIAMSWQSRFYSLALADTAKPRPFDRGFESAQRLSAYRFIVIVIVKDKP